MPKAFKLTCRTFPQAWIRSAFLTLLADSDVFKENQQTPEVSDSSHSSDDKSNVVGSSPSGSLSGKSRLRRTVDVACLVRFSPTEKHAAPRKSSRQHSDSPTAPSTSKEAVARLRHARRNISLPTTKKTFSNYARSPSPGF